MSPAITTPTPQPREFTSHLPAYVAGRRAVGADAAALASNESHYPPLPSVLGAIAGAANRANRYPDPAAAELRARIAADLGVESDEVVVGPGSIGVLQQLLAALCDPDDEVVFAWRSFEAYPILTTLAGARPVAVPLAGERHDLSAMADAVTDRTKIVLLCTPNNPTGESITASELDAFLARVPSRVLVVVDEAYREYDTSASRHDSLGVYRGHPNVCLLRTFSKAYGLAGLRVGFAIVRRPIADALRQTALPFAVSAVAQDAAVASLAASDELRDRVSAVSAERDRVQSALLSLGWQVGESQGNFVWLRTDDALRVRLVEGLADAGIMVRGYAGDGFRITIADPATNDRVLAALADLAWDGAL